MGKNDLKLVLIGETGIGKSQLGNFILRKEVFGVGHSTDSNTISISENISIIGDKRVTIVDTPGLNDTNSRDYDIMEQIISKFQNDRAIDGIILVYSFKKARKTQKDKELLTNLKKIFGDILKTRLKIIITNRSTGEEFDYEKHKIEKQTNDLIKMLDKMICKEDIIFVNTLNTPTHMKLFYPQIENLLDQFYKVKVRFDSMNNELIKKQELEIIERKKKEIEEERKKEKKELEKKIEKEKKELEKKIEKEKKELVEKNQRLKYKRKWFLAFHFFLIILLIYVIFSHEMNRRRIENEFVQSINKLENSIKYYLKNVLNENIHTNKNKNERRVQLKKNIFDLENEILDSQKEINRIEVDIKHDNTCITATSVFVPFTLGITGIGISHCIDQKKKHQKELEIEKQKLFKLEGEKSSLENELKNLN